MADHDDIALARAWLEAARDEGVRMELLAVYADIAEQIAARGPACWASGRCCSFEKTGHLLYVTGLEAAYTVVELPEEQDTFVNPGGCEFQRMNLCTVHTIKPLGCRVYFCDRSAQGWQQTLTEHGLGQLREIHRRRDIPYRYGERRAMLEMIRPAL